MLPAPWPILCHTLLRGMVVFCNNSWFLWFFPSFIWKLLFVSPASTQCLVLNMYLTKWKRDPHGLIAFHFKVLLRLHVTCRITSSSYLTKETSCPVLGSVSRMLQKNCKHSMDFYNVVPSIMTFSLSKLHHLISPCPHILPLTWPTKFPYILQTFSDVISLRSLKHLVYFFTWHSYVIIF